MALAAISGIPAIIVENENASPPNPKAAWVEAFMLPAPTVPAGIGLGAYNFESGIYQVSVYAPPDTGRDDADVLAEKIRSAFKRGTVVDGVTTRTRVETSWVGPANNSKDDGWYMLPVSIRWFDYTVN